MSKREDEYWAAQKEGDLLWCDKHKHYYDAKFGCQFCGIENAQNIARQSEKIVLVNCPHCNCKKKSLAWIEERKMYECFNPRCKATFSKDEHEAKIKEKPKKKWGIFKRLWIIYGLF